MDLVQDSRWLANKFPGVAVAFGLALRNAASGHDLVLVDTYLHYGVVDPAFAAPARIKAGESAIMVATNSYGYPTGRYIFLFFLALER